MKALHKQMVKTMSLFKYNAHSEALTLHAVRVYDIEVIRVLFNYRTLNIYQRTASSAFNLTKSYSVFFLNSKTIIIKYKKKITNQEKNKFAVSFSNYNLVCSLPYNKEIQSFRNLPFKSLNIVTICLTPVIQSLNLYVRT